MRFDYWMSEADKAISTKDDEIISAMIDRCADDDELTNDEYCKVYDHLMTAYNELF